VIPFLPARGGSLDVICGPMFSGKSEELLRRIRRAEIAQLSPLLFKPSLDDRYGEPTVEVASLLLVIWLGAAALGDGPLAAVHMVMGSWFGQIILFLATCGDAIVLGLGSALVHAVCRHGFDAMRLESLVIIADPQDVAIGVYESLGFAHVTGEDGG